MNKNILSNVIMFATGAAIGSVVTWKLLKTKYENLVQEEVAAIREVYAMEQECNEDDTESEDGEEDDAQDKEEYKKIASRYSNDDEDEDEEEEEEEEGEEMIEPYVIVPEEFDENGYDTATLFYYADGVLAYGDTNEVVENVEDLVCEDFADHFGEYEADSVFVRNDNLKMDFEILRDLRPYSEVE